MLENQKIKENNTKKQTNKINRIKSKQNNNSPKSSDIYIYYIYSF